MDGFITIGTKLDTDKFDRQVHALEKRIEEEEEKKIEIEADIDIKESGIKKVQEAMDEAPAKLDRLISQINEAEAAMESISPNSVEYDIANQKLLELKIEAEACLEIMRQGPGVIDKQTEEIEKLKAKQIQVNEKVDEYKQKIENINVQRQQAEIEKMKKSFNGVGSAIQSGVKKLGAMAISIIGIRAGINMLRNASSQLASYDSEYAAKLEYIRFALTQAIAPVLKHIVDLALRLLQIVGAIAQGWFGVNIFEKGSVDNFKKMKAKASGVGKAVREIKKQLAGFDEMNILQDNRSTSTGGGGGGIGNIPDLSSIQGETPPWLDWIIKNKDIILAALAGIAAGLIAIKLGMMGIKALGFGVAIAGIVYAIENLVKFMDDPSFENFGNTIIGIGTAIVGVALMIANPVVAIVGLIVLMIGVIFKYWDQIKTFLDNVTTKIYDFSDFLKENLGIWGNWGLWKIIGGEFGNAVEKSDKGMNALKGSFHGGLKFVKGVFSNDWEEATEGLKEKTLEEFKGMGGIVNITKENCSKTQEVFSKFGQWIGEKNGNLWNKTKEIFGAVAEWFNKHVVEPIKDFFEPLFEWFKKLFHNIWDFIKSAFQVIADLARGCVETIKIVWGVVKDWFNDHVISPIKNFFTEAWNKVTSGGKGAWNGIKETFGRVGDWFKEKFGDAWQKVKDVFSTGGKVFDGIKEGILNGLKNVVNAIIRGINKVIAVPFNGLNTLLEKLRNISIMGKKPFEFIHTFSVPEIPQLKTGGIINMPNRGTLVGGSAIGGEAGREGVVPLTDQQAMAELGREIGKNVLVNLTNITSMNGRVISRELKNIRSQQDFAYNI